MNQCDCWAMFKPPHPPSPRIQKPPIFGLILLKLGGEVYFILTNTILLSNTGTEKILSRQNSVVDPYTVQIFFPIV